MTAEPRMEDLLASIRKAINEDIAEPASTARDRTPNAGARSENPVKAEEESSTLSEIQQLREKIRQSRASGTVPPRDPAQRAASLAAALRSETPRRSWKDLETAPPPQQPSTPPPRMRPGILEAEAPRAAPPVRPPQPAARPLAPRPAYEPVRPVTERLPPLPRGESGIALSGGAADAVQSAFGRLADTAAVRAMGERSIEDMTKDMLRGMLKKWLDENLPQLVERLVREEIERVARIGR